MCEPLDDGEDATDDDCSVQTRPLIFDWVAEHLERTDFLQVILQNRGLAIELLPTLDELALERPDLAEAIRTLQSSVAVSC
jgi:hypothetical protein